MTNAEKYKTADERARMFERWCDSNHIHGGMGSCSRDSACHECHFVWLNLKAEEEMLLPCPYCGGVCEVIHQSEGYYSGGYYVMCRSQNCYASKTFESRDEAVSAHNRAAYAVMDEAIGGGAQWLKANASGARIE